MEPEAEVIEFNGAVDRALAVHVRRLRELRVAPGAAGSGPPPTPAPVPAGEER